MNEPIVRLAIVAAVIVVVAAAAFRAGRRKSAPSQVADAGLRPGIYLLSADGCEGCDAARQRLLARLGAGGFTELAWEEHRATFDRIGVRFVPSTLVVTGERRATLFPGAPESALAGVDP